LISAQAVAAVLSGTAVGFSLGVIGGGGSILAVPLLLYAVGITDAHVAIGTSALAVSVNAFVNLIGHWRAGTVHWTCAVLFGFAGAFGAAIGSTLGKLVASEKLLVLFALIMIVAGVSALRPRRYSSDNIVCVDRNVVWRLAIIGFAAGSLSGFFGIGGGFLIVPGIMFGSGLPILNAIGSSLFSVGLFAMITAANYALSGFIAWPIAAEFIAGGAVGGVLGMRSALRLGRNKRALNYLFAGTVFVVALYMLVQSAKAFASG
jgi:uncharacterized membrane protein YfcA